MNLDLPKAVLKKMVQGQPGCVDGDTYRLWLHACRQGDQPPYGFCTDCTPDYKRKKTASGECNRQFIRFRVDKDGFVEGYIAEAA